MKLIDMVRRCRVRGDNFIVVTAGDQVLTSKVEPYINEGETWWSFIDNPTFLGIYSHCSNWKKSLINVNELRGIK